MSHSTDPPPQSSLAQQHLLNPSIGILYSDKDKYEVIAWYHAVQAAHTEALKKSNTRESFQEFVGRTHDGIHYNLLLEITAIPLQNREENYHILVGKYHEIKCNLRVNPNAILDELLASHNMTEALYTKIGKMLAGDKPPRVSLYESFVMGSQARDEAAAKKSQLASDLSQVKAPEPRSSCPTLTTFDQWVRDYNLRVVKSDEISMLPTHIVDQLLEMIKGLEARTNCQNTKFEMRLQRDEETFRDRMSALFERHDNEIRRIMVTRFSDLEIQALVRARLRREDSTLAHQVLDIFNVTNEVAANEVASNEVEVAGLHDVAINDVDATES
ncbi:hypothetical protein PTTG_26446 [Puccinia triticina 1-1 BBBD Race 1]|uniref:Uncharacterized protein n=1 Tax=Puccinia triticina (isolate 1-1 / race 1 (BBBD)) TaxID=630390 RepID=A0A180GTF1_PUCT1|nr:hypothetical protein PTTG_26446 [Puccinia triticina 1-1 BBBD Race 1]